MAYFCGSSTGILFFLLLNFLCQFVSGNLNIQQYNEQEESRGEYSDGLSRIRRQLVGDQKYNLYGKPGYGYYTEVEIGTPPQKLNVLIDTGSSNFAVACENDTDINRYFNRGSSSTYKDLGREVHVPYTVGSWRGVLGQDYVRVTSLPEVKVLANIACITKTNQFYINGSNWQGILGMAYAGIARPDSSVEPFFDSLTGSGKVADIFSLELCGTGYKSNDPEIMMGGALTFGLSNETTNAFSEFSTPLTKAWYYEVVITDIGVNGTSLNMDCKEYNFGKTIIDSGTTNLRLPKKVFKALVSQIINNLKLPEGNLPRAAFWSGDEVLCWLPGQVPYNDFPSITLTLPVNDTAAFILLLVPQNYLRAVVDEESKDPTKVCFKFAVADSDSGTVLGAVAMEGYHIVFNRENKTIQFSPSNCSVVDNRAMTSSITWATGYKGNYKDCEYKKPEVNEDTLTIVGYVMAGIVGVCLIPLIIMIGQSHCRRSRCRRSSLKRTNSDSNNLVAGN